MRSGLIHMIFACLWIGLAPAAAQQQQLYTQFMFHRMEFNPAESGMGDRIEFTGAYRSQWAGLEGAPQTQVLSASIPFSKEMIGLGFSLHRHTIGITSRLQFNANYAYRIPLSNGWISLGLSASLRQLELDFTDERLLATEGIDRDPAVARESYRELYFNFGPGALFRNDRLYIGIGAPRVLQSDVSLSDQLDLTHMERRHLYLMGGVNVDFGKNHRLTPQMLVKYVDNAPVNLDLNVSAWWDDLYLTGLTWRSYRGHASAIAESIDILAGLRLDENWFFCLSYDLGLSALKNDHSGSFEAVVRYRMKEREVEYINPRFF